jgi:hypothetical protein
VVGARALVVTVAVVSALCGCGRVGYEAAAEADAGVPAVDAFVPLDARVEIDAFVLDGGPPDRDGDGVPDDVDLCPDAADPRQHDEDADGVGDACDRCPHLSDPAQDDGDADGVGDACDPDDTADNEIVAFLSFDDPALPPGWAAVVEAGSPWTVADGDLSVSMDGDDVALFTTEPTPSGARVVVETELTIDAVAPWVSGYAFRTIAIVDDAEGAVTADDATWLGLIQNAQTGESATLEALLLRAGRTETNLETVAIGAPLAVADRHRLRYERDGSMRSVTLVRASPLVASGDAPVIGGGIGLRVRGLSVRFHYLVVIR